MSTFMDPIALPFLYDYSTTNATDKLLASPAFILFQIWIQSNFIYRKRPEIILTGIEAAERCILRNNVSLVVYYNGG